MRRGMQSSRFAESGASVWSGLEDSQHEPYTRSQAPGNNAMHSENVHIHNQTL